MLQGGQRVARRATDSEIVNCGFCGFNKWNVADNIWRASESWHTIGKLGKTLQRWRRNRSTITNKYNNQQVQQAQRLIGTRTDTH